MADEAEEVNLSEEESRDALDSRKKTKKTAKKSRVMGASRLISGQIGAKILRGEPAVGPVHPIPAVKGPYPNSAEPAMLRHECITHMPGSNYEHERCRMLNMSEVALSMSYTSASKAYSSDGSRKKVAHMAWLAIPACKLVPNPSTLVDFRVENHSQVLWATAVSFFLSALSNVGAHSTVEQRDRSTSLEPGVFVAADGSLQPRSQAFIHRIFAPDAAGTSTWEELIESLPSDPLPGASLEEIAYVKKPNVFAVNHVNHPSRFVGYLIQIVYHDPTLDPNVQIKAAIQNNRNIKGVDSLEVYEQSLEYMLFRTNHEAILASAQGGGGLAAVTGAVPPSAYGLEDPAEPTKSKKDESSRSEAEDVGDVNISDLDQEKEEREAEAMRNQVEKRAQKTRENPADTEEGRRFAERMRALLSKEKGALELNHKGPAADMESSTSDGGSYREASSRDGEEEGGSERGLLGAASATSHADDGMEDRGMTLDELLDKAVEENGGSEEDSEEKREIEEELEKKKSSVANRSKRKINNNNDSNEKSNPRDSDEAKRLDAEERALKEQSARLKKAGASDGHTASRRFALDEKCSDELVKAQHEKEKSAARLRGTAYQLYEHNRMQIAMRSQETLPCLFGRSILNLKLYSQIAVDAYLRAADAPECASHPNGLYDTEENLNVKTYEYDMNVRSPLHYSNILSFENARRILLRSFPDRLGVLNAGESPQFDYFSYTGTAEEPFLSIPFPWLATRYNPSDLNPETLAAYRPPGLRSAVDAIIEVARGEEERDSACRKAACPALAALYEHPRAPVTERSKRKADDGGGCAADGSPEKAPGHQGGTGGAALSSNTDTLYALEDMFRAANRTARQLTEERRLADAAQGKLSARKRGAFQDSRKTISASIQMGSGAPKSKIAADHSSVVGTNAISVHAAVAGSLSSRELELPLLGAAPRHGESEARRRQLEERRARLRHQNEQDVLSWIETAIKIAINPDDRQTINAALLDIRAKQGAERSAALAGFLKGSAYPGVADLCVKVKLSGPASGSDQAQSAAGDIDRPPHPLNSGAAAIVAARGDHVMSATKQLSEFIVNDPIEKLAAQRTAVYNQLVDLSLRRPLRSDIASMREWLDHNCPDWRDDPEVRACTHAMAETCQIPLDDYRVLIGMNYVREERLRHDWLAKARAVFCAESGDEVCSTLSVSNDALPDSIRNLLLHVNTRKGGRVFVRMAPTFDPTLTPLASAYARDIAATYSCKKVSEHFAVQLMRLLWNERLSMLQSRAGRQPDVFMLHGPPGVGKSSLFFVIQDACPPSSMLAAHHRSRLSLMTISGTSINHTITVNHEAPAVWVEGTRADPHNREQANMIKSVTTEQACDFQRNAEGPDGKRVLEKYHVVYHHNAIMGTNYFTASPDVKDRMLYETTMYTLDKDHDGAMLVPVNFAKSGSQQRLEELWRQERWDEMAVTALIEAMIACKALPDVDLSVFTAVSTAGQAEITRFVGNVTISHRPMEHGTNEARQFVLERTFHVYFRSEASPFIHLTHEEDPKTGESVPRMSMHKPKEFFARDLPAMIPTSLCCSYGEAIPAYFRLIQTKLLPYDHWRLMCIIAWRMGGFTDDYFHPSYYRYGIKLPDVLGRANQRRKPGNPPITSRRDTCSFLRDYYDNFETPLRRYAESAQISAASARKNHKRPQFASAKQFARICGGAAAGATTTTAASDDLSLAAWTTTTLPPLASADKGGPYSNHDPDLNPSLIYILLKPTLEESTAMILQQCKGLLSGIDAEVITSLLSDLHQRPAITAPIHRSVKASEIRAADLGFEGVTPRAGTAPTRESAFIEPLNLEELNQKVHYAEVPTLTFGMDIYHKRYFVAISTYALMVKWPELTYMALTAHEGPYTRRARCLLPMGYTNSPLNMHIWDTAPNPHGNGSLGDTACKILQPDELFEKQLSSSVLPGDHDARDRLKVFREQARERNARFYDLSRFDTEKSAALGEGGTKLASPLSTMDLEMTAFVKHLANIHYLPPRTVDLPPAQVQDILTRYAYIAPSLLCAPGNVEKLIMKLRRTCPDLKSVDSNAGGDKEEEQQEDDLPYPDYYVEATQRRNDHRAAKEEFERNPDQTIDQDAWDAYMRDIFPQGADTSPSAAEVYRIVQEVKDVEDRRVGDPLLKHHPRYPAVILSYMIWKRDYDRERALASNKDRIRILSDNELTLIATNAFKNSNGATFDNVYDYLCFAGELRKSGQQRLPSTSAAADAAPKIATLRSSRALGVSMERKGSAAVAATSAAAVAADTEIDSNSRGLTDGESSMDGMPRSDLRRVRQMLKAATNEEETLGIIQALTQQPQETDSKEIGKGPGRSRRADMIAAERKRRQQQKRINSEPVTALGEGDEVGGGEEIPRRRMRKMPDPYD